MSPADGSGDVSALPDITQVPTHELLRQYYDSLNDYLNQPFDDTQHQAFASTWAPPSDPLYNVPSNYGPQSLWQPPLPDLVTTLLKRKYDTEGYPPGMDSSMFPPSPMAPDLTTALMWRNYSHQDRSLINTDASQGGFGSDQGKQSSPPDTHWYDFFRDDQPWMHAGAQYAGNLGRGVAETVTGLASVPVDLINIGLGAGDALASQVGQVAWPSMEAQGSGPSNGLDQAPHIPTISELAEPYIDKILPKPATPLQQLATSGLTGALSGYFLGGGQLARAGLAGGTSAEFARQNGASPFGQALAALLSGGIENIAEGNLSGVVPIGEEDPPRNSTWGLGPYAAEYIDAPADGRQLRVGEQGRLNDIMDRCGCHRCGAKIPGTESGNAVADHQPPTALGTSKRIYPHCTSCSDRQGGFVRQELIRRNKNGNDSFQTPVQYSVPV
jgi:hypothetical protein